MIAWLLACAGPAPGDVAEVWVQATPAEHAALRASGVGFAEGVDGHRVRVVGTEAELAALAGAGWVLEPEDGDDPHPGADPAERDEALVALAGPDARVVQVGTSRQGRALLALVVGRGPVRLRVVGAHHGDEPVSADLAFALADALVSGDADDPELLDRLTVWVVPQANPDGLATSSRFNAADVDLNRNYDHAWSPTEYRPGAAPFSEPETRALRTLGVQEAFLGGLALHAGATNIGWVWNHTQEPSPEEPRLQELAVDYAEACGQDGFYPTNGADWYVTNGDATDWSYGRVGTLDFTVEASLDKDPADPDDAIEQHVRAGLAWMTDLARPNLTGAVTDAATGAPLPAVVELVDVTVPFLNRADDGSFQRLVPPGAWTVRVSHPGWLPEEVAVEVPESGEVTVAVALQSDTLVDVGTVLLPWTSEPQDLPLSSGPWTLSRPGYASVTVYAPAVAPTDLSPGAWTLSTPSGHAPRAVLVGNDGPATLTAATVDGHKVHLAGAGFAPGSSVLAHVGERRLPRAVPLVHATQTDVTVDVGGLSVDEAVDLWLRTDGQELVAAFPSGLRGPAVLDTGPTASAGAVTAGGCASAQPSAGASWVLAALLLLRSRRASCARRAPA